MKIFNGKKEAEKILLDLKKNIKKLKTSPGLAVILVGQDRASKLFIKNKKRAAKDIGVRVVQYKFKRTAKEKEVIQKIKELNKSRSVSGIIVQLPLPKGFNAKRITGIISPEKDVDGFGKVSLFQPVLPSAISIALEKSGKSLKSKKILALVNSDIFGKTLREFFKQKRIKISYILKRKLFLVNLKSADVVITAVGCPKLIKGNMVKNGAVLIDAGIVVSGRNKIIGDVDRESVAAKLSFLTPVPGGIGPLTVALLLKNVYLAKKHGKYSPTRRRR
ncbi:MAG: bifunctional 5,10-methylenetetrahydrofolate dehydrogenase/5,10-methenyltetrahydrofolate cyclohydrolase [bacterium]